MSWRSSPGRRIILVALLGVSIGGTAGWWAFPPAADAASCNLGTGRYNVVASDNPTLFSHNGIRVANPGMYVYGFTAYCDRVSSIESMATTGDSAEVGWDDEASGLDTGCFITGDGTPHILTFYLTGSFYVCRDYGQLTTDQSDDFSVWGASNDVWTWAMNGSNIQQITLDFRASAGFTNGERHSTFDSAEALFNGMQYGTPGSWTAWPQAVCPTSGDTDPDYNDQAHSATDISVSQSPRQC